MTREFDWLSTSKAALALGRSADTLKRKRDSEGGFLERGYHYSYGDSPNSPITWHIERCIKAFNDQGKISNNIWLGAAKASNKLGISQATLWNLKSKRLLKAATHWIYVTGLPKSNVLWNIESIRQWQIDETIKNDLKETQGEQS